MSENSIKNDIGLLLKKLLKQQSLSIRKLSKLTKIDPATISRIINGKRKATPEHLQKIAVCLDIPVTDLFIAAGFLQRSPQESNHSHDLLSSIDAIQSILKSSNLLDGTFTLDRVEQQFAHCAQFSKTKEGKETILTGFEDKLQKVGSIGPIINYLKKMYERFRLKNDTPYHLAIMGGALLYFIFPVDVVPDYIFPIGYLDDTVVVQLALSSLSLN